ncbi:hypothetical protein pb186bvf_000392 [Paramecium bursaria]
MIFKIKKFPGFMHKTQFQQQRLYEKESSQLIKRHFQQKSLQ